MASYSHPNFPVDCSSSTRAQCQNIISQCPASFIVFQVRARLQQCQSEMDILWKLGLFLKSKPENQKPFACPMERTCQKREKLPAKRHIARLAVIPINGGSMAPCAFLLSFSTTFTLNATIGWGALHTLAICLPRVNALPRYLTATYSARAKNTSVCGVFYGGEATRSLIL